MADDLQTILDDQDVELHKALEAYKKKSDAVLHKAIAALLLLLGRKLIIKKGVIAPTLQNMRILKAVEKNFGSLLAGKGYRAALGEIRTALLAQPEVLDKVLKVTVPKPPIVTPREAAIRSEALDGTIGILSQAPGLALQHKLDVAGESLLGISLSDLGDVLGDAIEPLPGRLAVESDTAVMRYYRAMAQRAFAQLQKGHDDQMRFRYAGPLDRKNRKFCHEHMIKSRDGVSWTKAEIEQLDNGQGLPVLTSNGGFGCRHQWIAAVTK